MALNVNGSGRDFTLVCIICLEAGIPLASLASDQSSFGMLVSDHFQQVWHSLMMPGHIGNMFSGFLQAAAYENLDGVHGLTGWRCVLQLSQSSVVKLTIGGCSSLMRV